MEVPSRQIQNSSSSALPNQQPATITGYPDHQQSSQAAPPAQPADFLVDLVSSLLVSRADAASILASVAARLVTTNMSSGVLAEHPGDVRDESVASTNARTVGMQHALSKWHAFAADRRRLRAISRSISFRSRLNPAAQLNRPGLHPGMPSPPPLPTVKVIGERSREERDAELRLGAFSISAAPSPASSAPTVRLTHTISPPTIITADSIPPEFRQSPSYALVGQVLRSHLDLTHRDWRSRAFYSPTAVAEYERWSDPKGQPHRDASDALADLSDPDVLGVPAELRSSDPDVSAAAWDRYRRIQAAALDRAFTAGVAWLRALRAMDLIYSDPEIGHPRISQYITSAMTDHVLLGHPLLHAEVLRFKLDKSFADGSALYSKESRLADWERTTTRLPGEDVVTLATRVTEAYLKKISDPIIDAVTVWSSRHAAREIETRFTVCLLADPVSAERGSQTNYTFQTVWGEIGTRVDCGQAQPSDLNIISIAENKLRHHEAAAAGRLYDLSDIDDSASVASDSSAHGRTGGRRTRRSQRRRDSPNLPGPQLLVVHEQ
jgi:hypothetical protein